MSETWAHEAWCPHCKVTHPPDRKTCLHCGGPVLPHRHAVDASAPPATRRRGPFGMPVPEEPEDEGEAQAARTANPLRLGFAAIWIVLGVVTAILRACAERG